jgi:hypothetical protein
MIDVAGVFRRFAADYSPGRRTRMLANPNMAKPAG